jgi:hypothetical protein
MNPAFTTAVNVVAPNLVDAFLFELATNKFFNAFIMIMMNIGGKYLALELPSNVDKLFQTHQVLRYVVIFAICFMATRDIKIAIFIALIVIIVLRYVLNESSMYCLVKEEYFENSKTKNIPSMPNSQQQPQQPQQQKSSNGQISDDDFQKARDTIDKYLQQNNKNFSPHQIFKL